jgi:predicted O-linked N-acetylglucosamine transferase (SPINDLY family)
MTQALSIHAAVAHHNAGRLAEAEAIYRALLAADPDDLNALNLLGVLARQTGRRDEALDLLWRAADLATATPDVHYNLGTVLSDLGRRDEAAAAFRRALALQPGRADVHNALGATLNRAGRYADALAQYRAAIQLDPALAGAYSNAGAVLMQLNDPGPALALLRRAVLLTPDNVDALSNLGATLNAASRAGEAIACYRRALAINPGSAEAWNNLGSALRQVDDADRAAQATRRALTLRPQLAEARLNLCICELPILYEDAAEVERRRGAYDRALGELEAWVDQADAAARRGVAEAIGCSQPFALPYQGRNDADLQRRYGRVMVRLAAERLPALAQAPAMPPAGPDGRLRIGFASAHLREHSVWKAITRGWLQEHDRSAFATHLYALSPQRDGETAWGETQAHRFVGGQYSAQQWAEIIRRDRLHVLVYPEIGMDPLTLRLATLRLAPVQCVGWGHPETSGLPTMDHYLSAERYEPAQADKHYAEALERLPGLGSCYSPSPLPPPARRAEFGLPDGPVLFLAPQTLFKYLPQHDEVLVRLARAVGDCRFVFFEHPTNAAVTRRFVARLTRAFAAAGLDWDEYGIVLARMGFQRFQQLMGCVDISLDSLSFSGFNTAIEAMACGLPLVTCRGQFMRARFAAGILDHIGLADTIATGPDAYVAIATRLARDPAWRAEIRRRQAERLPKAYHDTRPVRAMEALFQRRALELMAPPDRHAGIIRLFQSGQHAAALAEAERCLGQHPTDAVALHLAGLCARETGDMAGATARIARACALAPGNPDFQNSLGVVLRAQGLQDEAEASYRRALARHPAHPSVLGNLAKLLAERDPKSDEALALLQALAKAQPQAVTSWARLGETLHAHRRHAEAAAAFRNALLLDPAHGDSLGNLALSHRSMDEFDLAVPFYRRSLQVQSNVAVMINYASCLRSLERMDDALAVLDAALAREPESGNAHFAKSMILLLQGRLTEGWQEYAWRWRSPILTARPFPQPRWEGEPFPGKSLLIHTEQGMGDLLHLVRFLPAVKARGGTVYLELQPELMRLLDGFPGIDAASERGQPPPPSDLQIPLMDLPGALGITLENCTPQMPYLTAPGAQEAAWRERLAGAGGLKVGIVWAGNPDHANDKRRSMPPELLTPLLTIPGVSFFSLQVGGHAGKLTALAPQVRDLAPLLTDWTETAGALANLDLVITVDTSVCHLAGAMGRPVWTLLPIECDWRWLLQREDTPWYPTMRLFRHTTRGDWAGMVQRLVRELTARAAA